VREQRGAGSGAFEGRDWVGERVHSVVAWWNVSDNNLPLEAQVRDWLDDTWSFLFVKGSGGMTMFATIPPPLLT
jgi:hypothetical protein